MNLKRNHLTFKLPIIVMMMLSMALIMKTMVIMMMTLIM